MKLFHILSADQFSKEDLDYICDLTTKTRRIGKTKEGLLFLQSLLPHKRTMLYFTQPSTRTFLSFYSACQILGIKVAEVRDISTSSEFKGESQPDSIRTLSSYFDMIIMRSEEPDLAKKMAHLFDSIKRSVPIVNGGSGADEHPTQALLDIYTLHRSFEKIGGIDNKTITFVGDLKRGRTVRSLVKLLSLYSNMHFKFVAPHQLQISDDILDQVNVSFEMSENFDNSIKNSDAIYMTRIQDEWDIDGESKKIDISKFCFEKRHLDIIGKDTIIMHPLPRRQEISTEVDDDPRVKIWRQMRNGLWLRATLISIVFGVDTSIANRYHLGRD